MANRERGEVSFEASDKTWTMKLGTNAMCEIEEATGKGMAEIGELLSNDKTATIGLMRVVFWGALHAFHQDLTTAQAGELIDEIGATRAGQLIGEAFTAARPVEKAGAGSRPPRAAAA